MEKIIVDMPKPSNIFLVLLNFVDKVLVILNRTMIALNPIIAINYYPQFLRKAL
jgi:hypothetical protein